MEKYGKIAILENEVEAQVLDAMLTERDIPHAIRTYHDFAYDGLFQMQKGWGHVDGELDRAAEILEILQGLREGEEPEA